MHGCVWLAIYTRNGLAPFQSRDPKTDLLQPAYFQHLDQMVQHANARGIMMGLVIAGFPGNSSWWTKFGTQAREDRWFRYCVARYGAYNVRWVLYGEVNEANPPWGGTWSAEAARKAQLVKDEDPYDHPIGVHHTSVDTISATNANIDYIEIQHGPNYNVTIDELGLRSYGKPLWAEEYWYEYTGITEVGTQATYENFVKALCYPTFGSMMRQHDLTLPGLGGFAPTNAAAAGKTLFRYLLETDEGLRRIGNFRQFFNDAYTLDFAPATSLVNAGFCGRFGQNYALFLPSGGSVTLNLAGVPATNTYDVVQIDVAAGTVTTNAPVTGGGSRTISTGRVNATGLLLKLRLRPRIEMDRQGQGALLYWPVEPCGFQLRYTTNLTFDANFQRVPVAPTQSLTWVAVPVEWAAPMRFYRLQN